MEDNSNQQEKEFDKLMDEYEALEEKIVKENEVMISQFADYLKTEKRLADKTITEHCNNVSFYINVYLIRAGYLRMDKGAESFYLMDYFGYFFIYKCMWSTPYTIKTTAASIRKFYQYAYSQKWITDEQWDDCRTTIREEKEHWAELCRDYNEGFEDIN